MLRLVCVLTVLFTLALGTIADAKCAACLESVRVETDGASTTLRFTARSMNGAAFPDTGTLVVMQFDGNRGKCLTVSLIRTSIEGDQANYVGKFNFIYQNAKVLSGRADLGGSIYDFSVPLDGKPGTIGLSSYQGALNSASAPTIITPQPVVITPDPATVDPKTAAATGAAQRAAQGATDAKPSGIAWLAAEPAAWLGLIAIFTAAATAYLDRKRALARTSAA